MNISLITSAMSWVEFKINFKHNKRTCYCYGCILKYHDFFFNLKMQICCLHNG